MSSHASQNANGRMTDQPALAMVYGETFVLILTYLTFNLIAAMAKIRRDGSGFLLLRINQIPDSQLLIPLISLYLQFTACESNRKGAIARAGENTRQQRMSDFF
jgi:hypothetical protein